MNQSVDIERLRALRRELLRREEDIRASRVSTQREVEHQLHTIRQEHRQSYVRESLREVEHSMRAYCQSVREQEEAIHKKANMLTSLIQMYEEEAYQEKRRVQEAFARMRDGSDKGGRAEEVERPLWSERISGWMEEGIGWLNKGWEAFAAMCQEMFEANLEHSVEAIYKHGIGDISGSTLERIKGNLEGYYDRKALEEGMPVDTMTLRLYDGLMKDLKELGIEEGDRIALLGLSKEEGIKALELLYVVKAHDVQWEKEQRQQTIQMEDKFQIMTEVKGESNRYAFYQWLKTHAEQGAGIDLKALSTEEEAMLWKEIGRTSEYLVEAMESYLIRQGVEMEMSDRWCLSPEMVSQLTGQYREAFEEEWHKILEDQEKLESLREEFAGYREKQKQGLYGEEYEAKKDIQGNCYLYGRDVYQSWLADINGDYMMDSRYNDFGTILFRELGYTFEIPDVDLKKLTLGEYANLMGPIWEQSQKYETMADDLEDVRTVITILSAFSMYGGVEGVASAVALDTGLDTADTAVSIISGDQAGTILGILSIALPALMDDAAKGGKIAAKNLSNGIEGLSEAERVKLYKALEVEGITDIRKLDVDQDVLKIYSKETTYEIRMMDEVVEGTGKFVYKNNPVDNPKAMKDIVKNDDAVYGFVPDPNSDSIGGFSDLIDWTDPEQVAIKRAERIEYHKKNENIFNKITAMQDKGASTEDIAREAVNMRNQNRLDSYLNDPDGLQAAMEHNTSVYGNPNGAQPDDLFAKYGSWDIVIQKTVSANPGMDACLGLYDDYYFLYSID